MTAKYRKDYTSKLEYMVTPDIAGNRKVCVLVCHAMFSRDAQCSLLRLNAETEMPSKYSFT